MPNLEMHIEVPDFAVIEEVYLFSVINFYFLFFGFQLSQFYSVAIEESMTFWPHFPPGWIIGSCQWALRKFNEKSL